MKKFLLLLFISCTCLAQVTEKNYKIYSVKAAKEVSLAEVIVDAKNYQVIFFGEEHNDSVGHYLESKIPNNNIICNFFLILPECDPK